MPKSGTDARPLDASVQIAAPRAAVWAVVSNVRRTGEWSPECARVVPLGRLHRGTLLLGINRRGPATWATLSQINSYEPGRSIGWTVLTNRARWTYQLESIDQGTQLTQTRRTPRGVGIVASWFTHKRLGGQALHDNELEAGMLTGLERIRDLVESR